MIFKEIEVIVGDTKIMSKLCTKKEVKKYNINMNMRVLRRQKSKKRELLLKLNKSKIMS